MRGCRPEAARDWAGDQEGLSAALIGQLADRLAQLIAVALAERLGADEREGGDPVTNLVRSEFRKIFTTNTWWAFLVAALALTAASFALNALQ